MKCRGCGYFNLPDVLTCGRCRQALGEAVEEPLEDFLPPRAQNRTARRKLEAALSPSTRRGLAGAEARARQAEQAARQLPGRTEKFVRDLPDRAARGWQNQLDQTQIDLRNWGFSIHWWIPPLCSIMPGMGQFVQRRRITGAFFLAGFLLLLLGFVVSLRSVLSYVFYWAILAWMMASIYEAANASFPQATERAVRLRYARLAMLSFALVAFTYAIMSAIFSLYFNVLALPTLIATNSARFEPGDTLLLARTGDAWEPSKGDIVGLNLEDTEQAAIVGLQRPDEWSTGVLGIIAARESDEVAICGNTICVNGRDLPPGWLPQTWRAPLALPLRVPEGQFWIVRLVGQGEYGNIPVRAGRISDAELVARDEIRGRAVAIISPPRRRTMLRP